MTEFPKADISKMFCSDLGKIVAEHIKSCPECRRFPEHFDELERSFPILKTLGKLYPIREIVTAYFKEGASNGSNAGQNK